MAEVAVIMPAYNAERFIGEAIRSVLAQSAPDWELVIVDDGSQDGTAAIVQSFAADEPRITLLQKTNGGVSSARNFGLRHTQSDYVSFLDADDIYEPTYLEEMIGRLRTAPDLAFVCCDAFLFETKLTRTNRSSHSMKMDPPITLERVCQRKFNVYTAVSLRRVWFDRAGGFDEGLKTAEDFNLWLNILALGGEATFIDRPLTNHRISSGSLSTNGIQLASDTLQVYENLTKNYPELEPVCAPVMLDLKYGIALAQAKTALKEKRFSDLLSIPAKPFSIEITGNYGW